MERHRIYDFGESLSREPVMRRMKDGRIVCTFLTGGPTEPHKENVLKMSYSDDDGVTWSVPKVIVEHSERGVWCTELFNEGDDPFLVVMTYDPANHYRELQTFRAYSRDGGRTWEEPQSFPCGLNGVTLRQGIVMSNGEWLFPLYWQRTVRHFDWGKWTNRREDPERGKAWPFCCGVAVSGDRGAHYQRYGCLADTYSLWEPNCVELEDGHIVMLMRDDSRPYLRRGDSYDYGRTWGEAVVTDLPNPNTKLTLMKIDGKILLINNFRPEMGWAKRTNLEIWVSRDNMLSWTEKVQLAPPQERFFYPHAFADAQRRMLYVAYENAAQHYLCKLPYAELGL
ncbi:MAG TPA: sialidase family protein [Clostridia bacterium]|nr:sialidase family protein [Clostridia bacterium]